MTSPANPPKTNQAPTTAATSVHSYASAAGSSKPTIVASGSHPSPPVVVGSSTSTTASNAKPSPSEPVNGRPAIAPAVPGQAGLAPPVVTSSNVNGATRDHTRKNSLTIAPNGPSPTFGTNGGPVGGSKAHTLQFHYSSPHTTHNTPQPSQTAPVPIPSAGNKAVASPSKSPSPIPQLTASGGRPPSSLVPDAKPIFGSLPNDHERKGPQPTNPAIQNAQNIHHHNRQGSNISMSSTGDIPGQNMQHQGRGNYHGGRGSGRGQAFNPHTNFNPTGGFQQGGFGNGNGRGRGGMPPSFNPGATGPRPVQPFNNSPQPSRASPHPGPSHPGTPQMGAAMPVPPQQAGNFGYPPMAQQNITGFPPFQQGPQYAPPMGHIAPPMGYMPGMGYNNAPMNPYGGQANPPAYPPQYPGAPAFHPGAPNMSRTPSNTEKPGTPAGHAAQPVIVGNQPHQPSKTTGPFVKPRKSAAIPIKRPEGGEVDVKSLTTPASPAPSLQQSKTPPITTTSSTPPTKPSTPAHGRSDSHAPQKSAKEVQEELRAKIAQATKSSADAKEEEARAAAEKAAAEKSAAAEKAAAEAREKAEAEAKAKKAAEEKAAEEARLEAERKAKEEEEAKKAAEEAERKAKEEAAAKAAEEAERKKREEEEEIERMIAEMEEEDRRREEEQARITTEKEAKKATEKAEADKRRAVEAAENDRKLREQEREMERLEEEKEKRAQANAAAGLSVADLLAQSKTGIPPPDTKVDAVADKLSAMAIGTGDSKPSTPTSATGAKPSEKQPRKPAALNLSVNTKNVEAPQPSAALTSLKTSRFLTIKESLDPSLYAGLASPNPALNVAVGKRGQAFKYDAQFLLQFQKVFIEQPSVEFSTQVKQLIGDNDGSRSAQARTPATAGGRQNSRTNSGFPGNMATFGNFSNQARTLPPGTTSESRFAQSQAGMGRPPMGSGMSFGPGVGSFPRGNLGGQMARQPSNQGMGPNSPRQGSRAGRGGSQKAGFNTKESKDAKAMPLTQGQEVKALSTSSSGWKPLSLGKGTPQGGAIAYMDPEMVQRKVKAALNKMTPENFDRISEQILQIANQSKQEKDGRTLRQVIQLTFEKATDEPHFSSTYAKFCKRMLDQMSNDIKDDTILDKHGQVVSGGNLFRKYLLNRCQEEFEKGWSVPHATDDKKEGPAVLMSDEYYENAAVKRRGLGLVRFIGELYKLGMLTERIITGCIHGLIDYKDEPKEAEIESLCFLMRTVGQQLEATEKSQAVMQVYFERIQKMIDLPNLDNRLKFMLMDVRDLRNNGWQSKEANKGPKTLEEIRAESQADAIARQQEAAARSSNRGGIGGGRGGGGGRGDSRTFSAGYSNQASNTVGMDDLRRLKSGSRPTGAMTLGPHSMLASRSNSGRRGGPGGLGRTGEDSGMSSRTGTPPTHAASHSNAYGLLANLDAENPASPPSTAASPSMSKVHLDTSTAEKKD